MMYVPLEQRFVFGFGGFESREEGVLGKKGVMKRTEK